MATNRGARIITTIYICQMQRDLILTKDGSHTIAIPAMNVTYHSLHGAIQESQHVFIEAGLKQFSNQHHTLYIFEMGFGTGLNALLTYMEIQKSGQQVYYTAIELFPLEENQITTLNYCEQLNRKDLEPVFHQLHNSEWEKDIAIENNFTLRKSASSLLNFSTIQPFNLIYFDAFAPTAQPELWTKEIFEKLYTALQSAGMLVTYCSKSDVRRAIKSAGFIVEKIPGPRGKREMVRAKKGK